MHNTQPSYHAKPVFVVGASRSGTSVTRQLCNNSSDLFLTDETHYFEDLYLRYNHQTPLNNAQRKVCEDYFLALAHRPYGHGGDPEAAVLSRDELRRRASSIGATSQAYFEAYCQLQAHLAGKARWGEKTPRHIYCIDRLLALYPDAQIICVVRDPRAVVLSYRDWYRGKTELSDIKLEQERQRVKASYHIVLATLLWRSATRAALKAQKTWGANHIYLLKYEDLLLSGETTVRALSDWLGLTYSANMLDVPTFNSSFEPTTDSLGLPQTPLQRWREKLSEAEMQTIEYYCGETLSQAGYTPLFRRRITPSIIAKSASLPLALARAALANRKRIANLPKFLWQRLK